MVWLLSFVCGNFSAVFRIAFAIDLIVTLVRAFIASLAAVSMAAPTSIFCPVNNSLTLFIRAYSPRLPRPRARLRARVAQYCAQQAGVHMT